jgi:hypothetical protein
MAVTIPLKRTAMPVATTVLSISAVKAIIAARISGGILRKVN